MLAEDVQDDVAKIRVLLGDGVDGVNKVFVFPVRFCRQLELRGNKINMRFRPPCGATSQAV
jgi:hypothetical protein